MRTVALEVRRAEDWETVIFEEIETLQVAGGKNEAGFSLTLIGIRSDVPNQVESGIIDIADRHMDLVDGDVPRADDGTVLPIALRDKTE